MKAFTVEELIHATGGVFYGTDEDRARTITFVTRDSRTVKTGALYAAFVGTRVDGHDFLGKALLDGAACCLSERVPKAGETPCVVVEQTRAALGRLAAWYRTQFDIPVVGITGSVGKTTTKEMIAAVLSARFNVHKTQKNFNNELGVPETLLNLEDAHEVSVVEMGISDFGEMRRLTSMVRPKIAVMSIIGESHLEFLGDRAGVLRAKSEIFESMTSEDLAVLNGDDEYLKDFHPQTRRVTYGFGAYNDFVAEAAESLGEAGTRVVIAHDGRRFEAVIPAFGVHMVYAALAATAVAASLGMTDEEIVKGISKYEVVGERARVIHAQKYTVVSDCYNANPVSCAAAFESLKGLTGRRVCILGDMLELGEQSAQMHYDTGAKAARSGAALVLTAGPLSKHTADGAQANGAEAHWFETRDALTAALAQYLKDGDAILVKASHSMAFEHVTEALTKA